MSKSRSNSFNSGQQRLGKKRTKATTASRAEDVDVADVEGDDEVANAEAIEDLLETTGEEEAVEKELAEEDDVAMDEEVFNEATGTSTADGEEEDEDAAEEEEAEQAADEARIFPFSPRQVDTANTIAQMIFNDAFKGVNVLELAKKGAQQPVSLQDVI